MNIDACQKSGQVLLRFMLYTDVNRRRATQVGVDKWVDCDEAHGGHYGYGTEHELTFEEFDNQPARYVVAMLPHLKQTAHPEQVGSTATLWTIYLTTEALWPFFEVITRENLATTMIPVY